MRQTLLMIEDDRRLAGMVVDYMTHAGFDVAHAERAAEGLAWLAAHRTDLVILDLMLPDGNGLDVCRNIRAGSDLRGFTRLSETRLPYDVVHLLNRYFEATGSAIDAAGGITNQFTGDGVMALFGVHASAQVGARQALKAARDMTRAVARLSEELREELPAPLKMGIGIHCGPTVVGHMGRGLATHLTAVGDAVNTASRLPDQTKHFACQLIFSERVAERAGLDASIYLREEISVRNRDAPIAIRIVVEVKSLALDASAGAGRT